MNTKELIERYCEETNALNNEDYQAIIVYGSRAVNRAKPHSDLDVFIITSKKTSSRKAQVIDGIHTETMIKPLDYLEQDFLFAYCYNEAYYDSVFHTGIVIKDTNNIVKYFKEKLNKLNKNNQKRQKVLPETAIEEITYNLEKYKRETGAYKKSYYITLLDWIHLTYHYMYDHSEIHINKIYEMYLNKTHAENDYKLYLPKEEFKVAFLEAMCDYENMDNHLKKLFKMITYNEDKKYPMKETQVYTRVNFKNEIMEKLIFLNKDICKVEEMLLVKHPAVDYSYFLILNRLKKSFFELDIENEEFTFLFDLAINETDIEKRIRLLEELFHVIDYKYKTEYNLDYDDYTL